MPDIVNLTQADLRSVYGELPIEIIAAQGVANGSTIEAVGGVARLPEDHRLWAFFDVGHVSPNTGLVAIRAVRAALRRLNEDIYIQADGPHAARLLRWLGFVRTEETRTDLRNMQTVEVWKWLPSQR